MSNFEENIPQWKRELIQRRRTLGRAITSAGGMVKLRVTCPTGLGVSKHQEQCSQDFHPDYSVRTMRLLDSDLPGELIVSGINSVSELKSKKMVEEKPVKKPSFRKDDKNYKTFSGVIKKNGKEEEYQSDSSEELQYGPGIVNKLKSKYLSMTLRDNQKYSSRPSLSNLRRATSLENMLEDDANKLMQKPHFIKKPYHSTVYKSSKISQHHAKYLGLTRGSESMKRARSMDTLVNKIDSKPNSPEIKTNINGIVRPNSIINEDLIIVDNNSSHVVEEIGKQQTNSNLEDRELPPPDLVKQTLKIFEPANAPQQMKKINVVKGPSSPNVSPVKVKNTQIEKPKLAKPLLSPKPILSPEKRLVRPKILSPKRVFPVVTSTGQKEGPKSPSKPLLSPNKITSPVIENVIAPLKFTPLQDKPPVPPPREKTEITSPIINDKPLTPTKCLTSPSNESDKLETKTEIESTPSKHVSQKVLESIGKEGTSMTFSFNENLVKSYLPKRNVTQATNTALITSQSSSPNNSEPNSPQTTKQVAVIRPVVNTNKTLNLTEQEIEKNLINKVKSVETLPKIIQNKNDTEKTTIFSVNSEKPPVATQLWEKKTWQSQNTMVFNFSARQSVPDYIENDGLNLATHRPIHKLNGGKDEGDGSGEDEWEMSTICNVLFVGDNILINGKSNLRKEPKESKISSKKLQFNDEATILFEYPSEESMNDDILPPVPNTTTTNTTTPTLPMGGPNLSSYTPSKTVGRDTFELGVTRAASATTSPLGSPLTIVDDVDYLKPVDTNQETTWSQETTADILF